MKLASPLTALIALALACAADAKGGKEGGTGKSPKGKKMKPCKQQTVIVYETFDDLTMIFQNRPDACQPGGPSCNPLPVFLGGTGSLPRVAGDYDVWFDRVWYIDSSTEDFDSGIPGTLAEVAGNHKGRCMWVSDSTNVFLLGAMGRGPFDGASICAGTVEIDDEDGRSSIEIAGSAPSGVTNWIDADDVMFSVTGGTNRFMGGYGFVDPKVYFANDPTTGAPTGGGCYSPEMGGELVDCIQFIVEIKCPKWDFDD